MGVKIWGRGHASRCSSWTIANGAVEIYDRARFFAVTGCSNGVTTITDHQVDLDLLIASLDRLCGRAGISAHAREQRPAAAAIGQRIPAGRRHNSLVSLAGTLWRRGLDLEEIETTCSAGSRRQHRSPRAQP
jgi:hypothetical protein